MMIVVGVVLTMSAGAGGGMAPDYSSGKTLVIFKCKVRLSWHSNVVPGKTQRTTDLSEDDATSWCISTSRASTHGHYGHVMAHQTTSIAPIWAAYWWSPQSRYFVWNCAKNLASHEWASVRLCSYCWEMTFVIMTWMRCVIMTWMRCHLCQVVAEQWGISWKIRAQSSSTWTLSGDPESGHCIR